MSELERELRRLADKAEVDGAGESLRKAQLMAGYSQGLDHAADLVAAHFAALDAATLPPAAEAAAMRAMEEE